MLRNVLFALVLGLGGAGVLIGLGVWQLQRLEWKEGIIAAAQGKIDAAPIPLPAAPDPVADRYRAVTVTGAFTGDEAHVLTSTAEGGPGFLILAAYRTDAGRLILIDRGYVPEGAKTAPRPAKAAAVDGNLVWPDDVTGSTPPYDAQRQIWYGRDLPAIAAALRTKPILIVARNDTGDGVMPQPVTVAGFRNNHWQYAVTWFSLAAVWLGMTAYLLWRIRARRT